MTISFSDLWTHHPYPDSPCSGGFTNQCAIRMGVALEASGLDTTSFDGARCWSGDSPAHILRAEELARWLALRSDVGRLTRYTRQKTAANFMGKRGIIFIKDGWGAGDHIDLWDGIQTKRLRGGYPEWIAQGRQTWFWQL